MSDPVLIVGGGLAGLHAARLLGARGVPVHLREARPRLGGRILTDGGFDLGPSWFWPRMQPAIAGLVAELGLATFPQHSDGDILFHRMSREGVQRYRGAPQSQEPESMRLVGGASALVDALANALAAALPPECVRTDSRLTQLTMRGAAGGPGGAVEARFVSAAGAEETVRASHVVLALPPRLLAATVSFSPALDATTAARWRDTPTWMAPHAKFFAIYDRAFWREAGLSGTAQSMVGPLVEIHDATPAAAMRATPGQPGVAGLFGFVGVPAAQRRQMGEDALVAAAVQQLVTLFGPEAGAPRATLFKDWAADPLTATELDWTGGAHPPGGTRDWVDGAWRGRITLAGSETSPTEPGYLAGAVHAAECAVAEVCEATPGR